MRVRSEAEIQSAIKMMLAARRVTAVAASRAAGRREGYITARQLSSTGGRPPRDIGTVYLWRLADTLRFSCVFRVAASTQRDDLAMPDLTPKHSAIPAALKMLAVYRGTTVHELSDQHGLNRTVMWRIPRGGYTKVASSILPFLDALKVEFHLVAISKEAERREGKVRRGGVDENGFPVELAGEDARVAGS